MLPAYLTIDYNEANAIHAIKTWAGKDGLAAVVVKTGSRAATVFSLDLLRTHGICMPVGLPVDNVNWNSFTLSFAELVIKASLVSMPLQAYNMLRVVAQNGIRRHNLHSQRGAGGGEQILEWELEGLEGMTGVEVRLRTNETYKGEKLSIHAI